MKFPEGSFERTGSVVETERSARFECGVCWQIYDPEVGDAIAQIPPGTAFAELPDYWVCPDCEASRDRFLLLDES